MTKQEFIADLLETWLDSREDVEDCSCAEAGEFGGACWYHLDHHNRREMRVESLSEYLSDHLVAE